MGSIRGIETLEDEALEQFEKFITMPTILFNDKEVLYLNDSCKLMLNYKEKEFQRKEDMEFISCLEKEYLKQCNHNIFESTTDTIKQEVLINKNNKDIIWVEYIGKVVIYKGQKSFLAHLYDITDKKLNQLNLYRISRLRALMLEVTQSILKIEDINQIFQLILKNSLIALEKSTIGTILIKEGDYFTVASSVGFVDDIKNFKLPYEDSFIYIATDGKMDRIANIGNILKYSKYIRIKTTLGDKRFIESTITVPIYFKGSLFGTINVDSVERNAFDEEDVKSMEFIRSNVEIAVSNHLLYKEKSLSAKYDWLTHLYNRSYFEESFLKIKEKAVKYNEIFQLVMFDIDG
ncbi:MAG: PAS domain S-box protein [Sedimentibacter sp.]|uniref:PAS domain S-box protein n=1 Tax=Sedimentibacter sp. TaxID=1960295 RepID=UPI0029822B5D|nr:PAS domain S-box protein [Sedimentibacter sp.]MDW5299832.1 PAS domain S-box protein [Sedimentibacter sp.]